MEQFLTIDEMELDAWNGDDVDNSTLKNGVVEPTGDELMRLTNFEGTYQVNAAMKAPYLLGSPSQAARYIPFRRNLKRGSHGNDVLAVRRALSRAGFGDWGDWGKFPKVMGPYMVKNLKLFQKKHGLVADGEYGIATHKKLMPYFDSYGSYLMKAYKPPILDTSEAKRARVVSAAMFGYQNRGSIHYTESTWRMYGVRNKIVPPQIPRYEDCSSFATWTYWVAGAPDPNGLGYNGQGYTGTLINHGTRVSDWSKQRPADLVFYGWSNGVPGHVAICVGGGRVVSHGSEAGPLLLPYNYRQPISIHTYL